MKTLNKLKSEIEANRTYSLIYVYNGDLGNQQCMEFKGTDILDALNTLKGLPEAMFEGNNLKMLNDELRLSIEIAGRIRKNKRLGNEHHQDTIDLMNQANQGCESVQKLRNLRFALYIALNIHEVNELDEYIDTYTGNVFVFDNDHTVYLEEENALMEQFGVPNRRKIKLTKQQTQTEGTL